MAFKTFLDDRYNLQVPDENRFQFPMLNAYFKGSKVLRFAVLTYNLSFNRAEFCLDSCSSGHQFCLISTYVC